MLEQHNKFILTADLHFIATNVRTVKTMVFPVVMYICESWAIKRLSTE